MCASVKVAEAELVGRVLCIESHWKRTSVQLEIFAMRMAESGLRTPRNTGANLTCLGWKAHHYRREA